MKPLGTLFYIIIFGAVAVFTVDLVMTSLTGERLVDLPFLKEAKNEQHIRLIQNNSCSDKNRIERLEQAKDPHLRKLDEYQTSCSSFATNKIMVFENMPKDELVAKSKAEKMADRLKEFSEFGVSPIIIVEPESDWGLIDFEEFKSGFYDDWIEIYFKKLKEQGITDEMMGLWVPFPEANLPYWNHNNAVPKTFSVMVNNYLTILKDIFPETKTSVLLNSATYETDDFNWANGEYVSLSQYVEGLDKELVDGFGIQGFSWMPPATSTGVGIFDAREYLNSKLAIEAADILGTKEVWFNTGSFSAKYTLDDDKIVHITPEKRKTVLNGIFEEVLKTKNDDYTVWVNIFAEDKSMTAEATDWSYLGDDTGHKEVFIDFARKLNDNEIPFSIFDISR